MARTNTEQLRRAAAMGPLVELGAGEGRFGRKLIDLGLACIALDPRYPPAPPGLDALAADAFALPFPNSCLGGVLVPNLMRMLEEPRRAELAREASRCLVDEGLLLILEDHPAARSPAEQNYRDTLSLLSESLPGRASATIDPAELELALEETLGTPYDRGVYENDETPEHPLKPLDWLEAGRMAPTKRLRELRARVEREGMRYGRYWTLSYHKRGDLSP